MFRIATNGPVGLRLIAVYKLLKAAVLIGAGLFVLRLDPGHAFASATRLVARFRLDADERLIHAFLTRLSGIRPAQLAAVGAGAILYGLLYTLEGVGLLLRRRWAEWLVVATTGLLIPAEVYELARKPGWPRATVLLVNLAVVAYLVAILKKQHAAPAPGRDSGPK